MNRTHAKILVLGGTGYLGRQIAESAASSGFQVAVFGRREIRSQGLEKARIVFSDARDKLSVVEAPENVDVIVNSIANYGRAGEAESEIFYANHLIPRAILDHYFNNSSRKPTLFLNIDTALGDDVSLYAKSKASFRKDLLEAAKAGAPIVGLRLDQFYGSGDAESKFITMLIRKFLRKAEKIPLSTGHQQRRFTFSSDVVKVVLDVVGRAMAGTLKYGLETAAILPLLGVESSVRDLVLKVQKLSGEATTHLDFGAIPDRRAEIEPRKVPSGFEFLEERDFVGLDEGIAMTIAGEAKLLEISR